MVRQKHTITRANHGHAITHANKFVFPAIFFLVDMEIILCVRIFIINDKKTYYEPKKTTKNENQQTKQHNYFTSEFQLREKSRGVNLSNIQFFFLL